MPAEKCKAGRGMAVGKHTFSLTLVVVTECAFCNAQLDECCYDSFHSWVHCSTVRCRNIAFLLRLSEKENCSSISVWCFKTCSVSEVHRQPEAWEATLSLSPGRYVYTILGKCFLQNLQHVKVHILLNNQCSDLGTLLLEQFSYYYPVQIFLAVIWA